MRGRKTLFSKLLKNKPAFVLAAFVLVSLLSIAPTFISKYSADVATKSPPSAVSDQSETNPAASNGEIEVGVKIPGSEKNTFNYKTYICSFYNWSIKIGGALTILMLIFAGYVFLVSAGNDTKLSTAKDMVTNALFGFGFLLIINLVLKVLNLPDCTS